MISTVPASARRRLRVDLGVVDEGEAPTRARTGRGDVGAPMKTSVRLVNPLPVMVMSVPPADGPTSGVDVRHDRGDASGAFAPAGLSGSRTAGRYEPGQATVAGWPAAVAIAGRQLRARLGARPEAQCVRSPRRALSRRRATTGAGRPLE